MKDHFFILIILFISCKPSGAIHASRDEYAIRVENTLLLGGQSFQYDVDHKKIVVRKGKFRKGDWSYRKVVCKKALTEAQGQYLLAQLSALEKTYLSETYAANGIDDTFVTDFSFRVNGRIRQTQIHGIEVEVLNPVFELINGLIDDEYKMVYRDIFNR